MRSLLQGTCLISSANDIEHTVSFDFNSSTDKPPTEPTIGLAKMFSSTLMTTILTLTSLAVGAPAPAPAPASEAAATFNAPAPYDFISLTAAGKNVPAHLMDGNSIALVKRNIGGVRMSDGKDFTGHVWVSTVLGDD